MFLSASYCLMHRAFMTFQHVKIFGDHPPPALSFFMSSWLAIIHTINRKPPTCLTLKASRSWSHLSSSPLNLLYHSKSHGCYTVLSPFTFWSISSACVGVFPTGPKISRFLFFACHWSWRELMTIHKGLHQRDDIDMKEVEDSPALKISWMIQYEDSKSYFKEQGKTNHSSQ